MAIPLGPGDKALSYALGGVMRGGVGRAGAVSGLVFIAYDGHHIGVAKDDDSIGTIYRSLSIQDALDETPNTCQFRVNGTVPTTGGEIVITLGSKNRLGRMFAGFALTVNQRYAARTPKWVQADVSAVDYTWLLGFIKVTAQYRNQSAATIITDLISRFGGGAGFTTRGVVATLGNIDEITFTDEDLPTAITRTVRRIGAYWYVDYVKDVHAFYTEVGDGTPPTLTPTHKSLANFTRQAERTQALSRVYCEGRGSVLQASVPPTETLLPLASTEMFDVQPDVFAKASFRGAEGGATHFTYSGVVPGGGGALVGTGIGPSGALSLAVASGGAVTSGTHAYASTFVTSAGESLPSPVASVTVGPLPNPTTAPWNLFNSPRGPYSPGGSTYFQVGDTVWFTYTWEGYENGAYIETLPNTAGSSPGIVVVSNNDPYNPTFTAPIQMSVLGIRNRRIKWIKIYMYAASRSGDGYNFTLRLNTLYDPGSTPPSADNNTTYELGITIIGGYGTTPPTNPPTTNTTGQNTVNISGIPIGGSSVTMRKLYRTVAYGTQLQFLATMINNTSTTFPDTYADAALGANVPTSDTSGLQQPDGQVVPGATALPVAGTGAFRPTGGWATIGNGEQTIKYTGVTGGSLTGIPASGYGSIQAAISYNTTVTASPMLTGVAGLAQALTGGDDVFLVVRRENTATKDGLATMTHGPGWREEWVSDRRLSIIEARARADATLALRPLDDVSIRYTCRDLLTASGKTIRVALPPPTNVAGEFKIQQVIIGNFRPHATQYPTFTVNASSSRFSFEDLLNRVKTKE